MAVPTKDTRYLRRKPRMTEVMKQTGGYLTDQSGNKTVKLEWDLNERSKKDNVFKMTIGKETAYIDLDELLFYTRTIAKIK